MFDDGDTAADLIGAVDGYGHADYLNTNGNISCN